MTVTRPRYEHETFHSRARFQALKQLQRKHPTIYDMLKGYHRKPGVKPHRVRFLAGKDLIDIFQEEFDSSRYDFLEQIKKDAGYVDQRTARHRR